ncbi:MULTISPECIES: hypothetical protein [unclassified Nostoc]|uniref:hypothetical protein n=1 Tax=unclassified Nostoc TaxID=2593658 RepID=UPI002608C691|nr:hypothetical protein [Nostoc sp. S13]MDF5736807.1 hypothetical protein [Nostoc sp. S13]
MNDDDYKVIGQALTQLTEADLQRINALLLDAASTRNFTASRLYQETWNNFSASVKPLRKIRNGFERLPLGGADQELLE